MIPDAVTPYVWLSCVKRLASATWDTFPVDWGSRSAWKHSKRLISVTLQNGMAQERAKKSKKNNTFIYASRINDGSTVMVFVFGKEVPGPEKYMHKYKTVPGAHSGSSVLKVISPPM